MKISEWEKSENEGVENLPSGERRRFLRLGLAATGLFLGGSVLSLTSVQNVRGVTGPVPPAGRYPYQPHYTMVIRRQLCIGCNLCMTACADTNKVPAYGHRTTVMKQVRPVGETTTHRVFMPVLCNQCNRPPCVRVCPTTATYKDKTNGIVVMEPKRCIGCLTCMTACPYDARYIKKETRAVDKCNFCADTMLPREGVTACAKACPTGARVFGDLTDSGSQAYQMLHQPEKAIWVLRPETGAVPNVFYMNV